MATAQLNVRIDADLKATGDLVLERFGSSAVKVVREAWQYMADHQKLPDYGSIDAREHNSLPIASDTHEKRKEASWSAEGLAIKLAREAGMRADFEAMSFSELRETAYEEMLIEEAEGIA